MATKEAQHLAPATFELIR